MTEHKATDHTADLVVHESAQKVGDAVETAPIRWAYAATVPLPINMSPQTQVTVTADIEVRRGQLGVGILNHAGDAFVVERTAGVGRRRITLTAPSADTSVIVFRNVSPESSSSFIVHQVVAREGDSPRYPVSVAARQVASESVPAGGGTIVFDDDAASAINTARMDFIRAVGLPLDGRRVLDVGAGVGHFSRLYTSFGARVVAVEGRAENVDELRRRYPEVTAHVADVQSADLTPLGSFDIVHCFGLLYHLDSPVAALRRIESVCSDVLLLETMVCDATSPVMVLADETMAVNQALAGLGCRPSPSFIALALNRIGFAYVYGAAAPPNHPDFKFEWRNALETTRDGHNLRCVFVASRRSLDSPALIALVEPD